jgi:hypothetical protein
VKKRWLCVLCVLLLLCGNGYAQQYDTASIFNFPIELDSVVISSGFDVKAFIRRVQTDTTFYKAFKSLHFVPYSAVNDIKVYDKDGKISATLHSRTKQHINNRCRTTEVLEQIVTGDIYKRNGDHNYYTEALFDHVFIAKKPVCNESDIVAGSLNARPKGQKEKSEYELKQLLFNPGAKVSGVPFMGDRASIFDEDEARKYDFKVTLDKYNSVPCYIFKITPKQGYESKVVYNELTTWFRKSDYSILARDYSLSYHTLVYDFDVRMKVRTQERDKKLYPTYISYDGNWHVFTQKRERVKFTIDITY